MKFLITAIILFCSVTTPVNAQKKHFIFLQTDNRQPFSVIMNKKVFSSTVSGYLIIPQLTTGTYSFVVGFPANAYPDQQFSISIQQKDAGYNLKKLGSDWALVNLQTEAITRAGQGSAAENGESAIANTGFIPVISTEDSSRQVQSDSTSQVAVVENPVAKIDVPVKMDTLTPKGSEMLQEKVIVDQVPDSGAAVGNEIFSTDTIQPVVAAAGNGSVSAAPAIFPVKRISQIKGSEAYYNTYIDATNNYVDTIFILIPHLTTATAMQVEKTTEKRVDTAPDPTRPGINAAPVQISAEAAPTFLNFQKPADSTKAIDVQKIDTPISAVISNQQPNSSVQVRSSCAAVATEDDFLKLRKTMAAQIGNNDMIYEARKTFKTKCFTSNQIRFLSYLFLTDEGRYQFFDAAYPHVADPDGFTALLKELNDPYFVNRFKAMLRP